MKDKQLSAVSSACRRALCLRPKKKLKLLETGRDEILRAVSERNIRVRRPADVGRRRALEIRAQPAGSGDPAESRYRARMSRVPVAFHERPSDGVREQRKEPGGEEATREQQQPARSRYPTRVNRYG